MSRKGGITWNEAAMEWNVILSFILGSKSIKHKISSVMFSRGEWSFLTQYQDLVIPETCWFSHMSPEAKRRHLNKIFSIKPITVEPQNTPVFNSSSIDPSPVLLSSVTNTSDHIMSVGWEECRVANISESTLQNIWRKAEQLYLLKETDSDCTLEFRH